jgi:hypothetical protein
LVGEPNRKRSSLVDANLVGLSRPEDILGSVEVDGKGEIVGNYQPSGTYRIVTNQGILGLSPFLQEKLIARLRGEEKKT